MMSTINTAEGTSFEPTMTTPYSVGVVKASNPKKCVPYTHVPEYELDDKGERVRPENIIAYDDTFISGGEHYECVSTPLYGVVNIKGFGYAFDFEMFVAVVQRKYDGHLFKLIGTNLANGGYFLETQSHYHALKEDIIVCERGGVKFNKNRITGTLGALFYPHTYRGENVFRVAEKISMSSQEQDTFNATSNSQAASAINEAFDEYVNRFKLHLDIAFKENKNGEIIEVSSPMHEAVLLATVGKDAE